MQCPRVRSNVSVVLSVLCSFVLLGCDPVNVLSSSSGIRAPLDKDCVVEALRTSSTVDTAQRGATGIPAAILLIPEDMEAPESPPAVGVYERSSDQGELEVHLEMSWVGSAGTLEYQNYVQAVLDELLERTIERCAGAFADTVPGA